jgi:hypothetical protein
LSSKTLLWIWIRIGSGFRNFVDTDPYPDPDWYKILDPYQCPDPDGSQSGSTILQKVVTVQNLFGMYQIFGRIIRLFYIRYLSGRILDNRLLFSWFNSFSSVTLNKSRKKYFVQKSFFWVDVLHAVMFRNACDLKSLLNLYFSGNIVVKQNVRPDIRYPALPDIRCPTFD